MNLRIEVIDNLNDLESSKPEWNRLAGKFPFFRWEWMANWQTHLARNSQPLIVVVQDEAGNWVGIAPFCLNQTTANGRSIELLSSGITCGDYLDLICDPEDYSTVASLVVDWLTENAGKESRFGGFDSIILEGVAGDSDQLTLLKGLFSAAHFDSHVSDIESCWEVALPATWEELNATFSKSHRRKTKKAVQRLADPLTQVRSSRIEGIAPLWDVFVTLHQLRRESLGEPGCFADPDFNHFLKTAVEQLAELDLAELVIFEYDGFAFGSHLLLNDGQRSFMYQSGIHPDWVKMEPGYQLIVWSLSESIARGFRSFDFLRGDEPYKARWNSVRNPLQRIKLVPPKLSSRLRHQIWLSGKSIKNYFNQFGLLQK